MKKTGTFIQSVLNTRIILAGLFLMICFLCVGVNHADAQHAPRNATIEERIQIEIDYITEQIAPLPATNQKHQYYTAYITYVEAVLNSMSQQGLNYHEAIVANQELSPTLPNGQAAQQPGGFAVGLTQAIQQQGSTRVQTTNPKNN